MTTPSSPLALWSPLACVISCGPLVLGIEAFEEPLSRGDATAELRTEYSEFSEVFRLGRIIIPIGASNSIPVIAKVSVQNASSEHWLAPAVLVCVLGSGLGVMHAPIGQLLASMSVELMLEMNVPSRNDFGMERCAWAIIDTRSGRIFGPLLVLEIVH